MRRGVLGRVAGRISWQVLLQVPRDRILLLQFPVRHSRTAITVADGLWMVRGGR